MNEDERRAESGDSPPASADGAADAPPSSGEGDAGRPPDGGAAFGPPPEVALGRPWSFARRAGVFALCMACLVGILVFVLYMLEFVR
jgi:hypothetical protein